MKKLLIIAVVALATVANPTNAQQIEGTWHGERAGVKFYPSGENIAYDKPAPTVHPKLTEHSQKMVPGVYQGSRQRLSRLRLRIDQPRDDRWR